MRLILDNLPVTTYDLKLDPESVRPGFELGFVAGDKHYIHNHLMFNILVRADRSCLLRDACARLRVIAPAAAHLTANAGQHPLGALAVHDMRMNITNANSLSCERVCH